MGCCSLARRPSALQHPPSMPPVSPQSVAPWPLLQVRQSGPPRAAGFALTCCCCRGRRRLCHGFPWFVRSWGSAGAAGAAVPGARAAAPSGHRAGRSSGSSAYPGCAASSCVRTNSRHQAKVPQEDSVYWMCPLHRLWSYRFLDAGRSLSSLMMKPSH